MGQLTLWCKRSFFEGLIMEYGLVVGVDLVCLRLGCRSWSRFVLLEWVLVRASVLPFDGTVDFVVRIEFS